MKWSTEAKVGAFTLAGLIATAIVLAQLSNFVFFGKKGYDVYGIFPEVNGLAQGNQVRYSGVEIGKVEEVSSLPHGAKVRLRIYDGISIPKDSYFAVEADGVMGEKFIRITPGDLKNGALQPGDTITGGMPGGIDAIMRETNRLLAKTQEAMDSVNKVIGDPVMQEQLRATVANANDMSARMIVLTSSLQQMTDDVNLLLARLDADGKLTADLRATAENFRVTSENARRISGRIGGLKRSSLAMPGEVEMLYNTDKHKTTLNANWRIGNENAFGLIGAEDIGKGTLASLQYGKHNGRWSVRAGLIRGEIGAGADYEIGKGLLTVDAYNLEDSEYRLRARWPVAEDWSAVAQSIFPESAPNGGYYFGVNHTF